MKALYKQKSNRMVPSANPDKRSKQDINYITPFLKKVRFFQELGLQAEDFADLVPALHVEYFESGSIVFNKGT